MSFNPFSSDVTNQVAETLGQDPDTAARDAYRREFQVSNFDSFGGDVTAEKFGEIARYKVPASTEVSWGFGRASNPENQGYLYVDLQNGTPEPVEGTLRLTIQSATGRQETVVADFDTTKLDASKTDRTKQVPLPEQKNSPLATQDSFLVLKLEPSSSDTVDSAESEVIIPVTEYDLS